jgi:hypothetical protein
LVGRPQAWKYSTIKKIEKEKSKRGRKRMRWRLFLLCLLPFKGAGVLKVVESATMVPTVATLPPKREAFKVSNNFKFWLKVLHINLQ